MQIHASCAARGGAGVLLLGPSGTGKSDLLFRLLDHGFTLVADDRVEVENGLAWAPTELAGLLEVRGIGIVRVPCTAQARLALAVDLAARPERLPQPARHAETGLPLVALDPQCPSAPARVALALACALGHVAMQAGAFAA
ncbi:MAG TPA: phosphotransferase [Acetobacteraceae bacterium]|nr:phosphotransferase [Acetobacteraceae bacterium]